MTTERLPVATPPGRQNRVILILAIVAGVLLLTVVAIVFLLIGRDTAGPGAAETATPTATPTSTPTETNLPGETPAPVDDSTRFTEFSADLTVECDPTGEQDKPEITFSWTAVNAVEAWYTPSDEDAKDDDYLRFPSADRGTNDDLTDEHLFPCNHDQFLDVTITLVGPNGEHVSEHVVYEDVNWQG